MELSDNNLDALYEVFMENFSKHGEIGATVSVWKDGTEVLSMWKGWMDKSETKAWEGNTMVPFYSATKGPASATLLMLLDENGLTPESRVIQVWRDFPNDQATFAELMSHQCGLAALDESASVYDYEAVISAIENQEPNWELGAGHGYHPRTYGFLLDELCRLLTGKRIGEMWREKIAEPLELDLWIGLPESEFGRVATLYPGKMDKTELESGFYKEFHQSGSLVKRAFSSPKGLHAVHEMNTPEAWQSALPAMGGVGTAQALAKFYQAAIGAIPFFSDDVLSWMKQSQVMGDDKVLMTPTHFSCGFQKDPLDENDEKMRNHYGDSLEAFGHPGAGGSHAFGDPESGISFAYTMNQMDLAVLPGAKSLNMIKTLYS